MTKYKKKTLVEAVPTFIGEGGYATWWKDEEPEWLTQALLLGKIYKSGREGKMKIRLKEGEIDLLPGSWIIRGANGAIWPLDNESFLVSYEKVED